jgi:AcrR family transcriptional regulator
LEKRISEIAKENGVSLQTVYRHLKKLDRSIKGYVCKEKGIISLNEEGEQLLKESLNNSTTNVLPVSISQQPALTPVLARLETIEKAVLMLVEENRRLANENKALRIYLLPPEKPSVPVIPWQPEPPKDPLEGMSWYHRAYIKVVKPWRMRRCSS